MKQFYPYSKTISTFLCLLIYTFAQAQSPTTVVSSNTCAVVEDFNAGNGNFTTPSIYADDESYQFVYTGPGAGGNMQSSSNATVAPYQASLISPLFSNTAPDGTASIGFSYTAPPGTAYRIRIIRPNTANGTVDILAQTSEGAPTEWDVLPATSGTICLQLLDADLHPNQELRYEFTFFAVSTISPITFDNFALSNSSEASLPVVFQGILAKREEFAVRLKWDVATEIDVKEYRVEKSVDGVSFTTAGTVPAKKVSIYTYQDAAAASGTVYYRIRSVDYNGSSRLSTIVKLASENSYSPQLRVYPTPARSQITVLHDRLGASARVTVTSLDGRVVRIVKPSNGASNTPVDVSGLTAGMYVIRLDDGNGKVQTTQFIKQ